ncbi:hypothetical protein AHF37_10178 [Paragonimus kellicotti]|nr:hypothetical protein AHF37_10178 [Paragonimus kellicotti]
MKAFLRKIILGTKIYFVTQRIKEKDPFHLDRSGYRRFYFDLRPGTIQPGIFKESWRLDTKPVLHGGLPIIIRLHGIAVWDEKFQFHESKKIAPALEIEKEANYRAIYRLLNNIISFFEPIQRPITPPDPMSTEPGAFKLRNPQFFYHHEVIQKLKKLYQELRERLTKQDTSLEKFQFDLPEQWNFSLNTLRKVGDRLQTFISD